MVTDVELRRQLNVTQAEIDEARIGVARKVAGQRRRVSSTEGVSRAFNILINEPGIFLGGSGPRVSAPTGIRVQALAPGQVGEAERVGQEQLSPFEEASRFPVAQEFVGGLIITPETDVRARFQQFEEPIRQPFLEQRIATTPEEAFRLREEAEKTFFFGTTVEQAQQDITGFGVSTIGTIGSFRTRATEFFLPSLRFEREERERELEIIKSEEELLTGRLITFGEQFGGRPLSPLDFTFATTEQESLERQIGVVTSRQLAFGEREKVKEQQLIDIQFVDPAGVGVGGFVKGFVSAPFDIAALGIGLATAPIKTGKELFLGVGQLPGEIGQKPVSTLSELGGSIVGTTLIFGGVGRVVKFPKAKTTKVIKKFKAEDIVSVSLESRGGKAIIGFETKTGRVGVVKQISFEKGEGLSRTFGVGEIQLKPGGKATQQFLGVVESKVQRIAFEKIIQDIGGVKVSREIFGEAVVGKGALAISPKGKLFFKRVEFGFLEPKLIVEKVRGIKAIDFETKVFVIPVGKEGGIKFLLGGAKAKGIDPTGFGGFSFSFEKLKPDLGTKIIGKRGKKAFEIISPEQQQQLLLKQKLAKAEVDLLSIASQATTQIVKTKPVINGKAIAVKKTDLLIGIPRMVGGGGLTPQQLLEGQGLLPQDFVQQPLRLPPLAKQDIGIKLVQTDFITGRERQVDIVGEKIIQAFSFKQATTPKQILKSKQILRQEPMEKIAQAFIQKIAFKQEQIIRPRLKQEILLRERLITKPSIQPFFGFFGRGRKPFIFKLPEFGLGDSLGGLVSRRKFVRTPSLADVIRFELGFKVPKQPKELVRTGFVGAGIGTGLPRITLGSLIGEVTKKKRRKNKK